MRHTRRRLGKKVKKSRRRGRGTSSKSPNTPRTTAARKIQRAWHRMHQPLMPSRQTRKFKVDDLLRARLTDLPDSPPMVRRNWASRW